jgi:hypothetical protein
MGVERVAAGVLAPYDRLMLLLYAFPIGVAAGLLSGGALHRLSTIRFRLAPVAIAGLVFQLALFSAPVAAALGSAGLVGPALYVGSTMLVLGALLGNARLPGVPLVIFGAMLNLVAIVANGGFMPAGADAWAALHGAAGLPAATLTNSVLTGPATALAFLGDNFVLPRPFPFANVFSIGDWLIAAGGVWLIARTMTGHAPVVAPPAPVSPTAATPVQVSSLAR